MKRVTGYLVGLIGIVALVGVALAQDYYSPWVRAQELTATTAAVTGLATVGQLKVGTAYEGAATVTIALAKSVTTDGMTITVTAKDKDGTAIAKAVPLMMWMSEADTCAGLTGDTYSGDLTSGTGVTVGALTAKKAWIVQTAVSGIYVGTLVASANPADQYVCIAHPVTATPVASAVSGTNWEGA
jgi:hypothetical protein